MKQPVSCPNCGNPKYRTFRYVTDRGLTVTYYNCRCGFSTWDNLDWNIAVQRESTK